MKSLHLLECDDLHRQIQTILVNSNNQHLMKAQTSHLQSHNRTHRKIPSSQSHLKDQHRHPD